MRKFLWFTLLGTAALALLLYAEERRRLKREARRFEEICPERPEEKDEPGSDGNS